MSYSRVEWDGVVLHYITIKSWLPVCYIYCILEVNGVNIGEGKELVRLCIVCDDYGYDMVVDGKVG